MPTYLLTFRFAANPTQADRQQSLLDQLQSGEWWAESGSTIVTRDERELDEFCDAVFGGSAFDPMSDMAVVFDLDLRDGWARGSFVDFGLFHIIPWLERS